MENQEEALSPAPVAQDAIFQEAWREIRDKDYPSARDMAFAVWMACLERPAPQSKPMEAQAPRLAEIIKAAFMEGAAVYELGPIDGRPMSEDQLEKCWNLSDSKESIPRGEALGEPSKAPASAPSGTRPIYGIDNGKDHKAEVWGYAKDGVIHITGQKITPNSKPSAGVDPEDVVLMDRYTRHAPTIFADAWQRIKSRRSPLVWTKEKPTKIGWYFTKAPRLSANMCQLSMDGDGSLYVAHFGIRGTTDLARIFADQLWAGPIPEPVSPDNSQEGT